MNNQQLDFAFVAELPIAQVPAKKRATRLKAPAPLRPPGLAPAAASLLPQTALAAQAADPAPRATTAAAAAGVGDSAAVSIQLDVESMARAVQAHPDYRVLRRLRPCMHWPVAASYVPELGVCRVVILDTETTGLDQSKDKIMELALLRVDVDRATGLPLGEVLVYDGLEDPGIPIPAEVQEITGITPDMVQGQRLDEARIAQLLDGADLVIAHNAGFDRPFCEARLPQFKDLSWACSFAEINWKEQGRGSAKLESLALELGWFYDAHRAEMDCHALLAVLAAPLPRASHSGMASLLQQSAKPSYRLQATNAPYDAKDKLKARGYRWGAEQRVWHTRVADPKALQAEFEWLKENAYNQRAVVVQFEKLDAKMRYSTRPVETLYHQL